MIDNYKSFDYSIIKNAPLEKRKRGNPRTRDKRTYKSIICAFDIETTRINDDESIMYIWQFQAGPDHTVTGRSWKECLRFFLRLAGCCAEDEYIVIFVHNLSFEFQFLRGQYHFQPEEVFPTGPRKVLKCDMLQHLEFRCSYLHSNMSLDEYTQKMGVKHAKLHDFDYNVKRYPWTSLTPEELAYCVHDVQGLVEAVQIEMKHDNDNLYSFPLTSTGYVRRDVKRAMKEVNHNYIRAQLPDWETYTLLREAFRGGNTHANRYYAGYILHNVKSADISSSYPSAECNNKFPVSAFKSVQDPSAEKLMYYIGKRKKAVLARVRFWGVRLTSETWGCPYIPTDKCRDLLEVHADNGRVLSADYLEITVTDIDLKIILSEYTADKMDCVTLQYARYGWLPDPLIDVIQKYYRLKTELKGVEGQEIFYMKNKAKLNSVYGMSAQNPVRVPISFDENAKDSFKEDTKAWGPALLEESNRKAFFCYQWGVWTTAYARFRLEEGLRLAHMPGAEFVYCDTDSVKYLGTIDWDAYNKERILDAEASLSFADDPAGNRHYMGVYEDDGEYLRFATRGAKKYAYTAIDKKGHVKLHITIAGVNKRSGAKELAKAGGLRAFLRESFTFLAGETEAAYVDHVRRFEWIDGHRLRVAPCVTIRPSFKTLSDTEDYAELLKDSHAFTDFMIDKFGIVR